MAKPDWVRAIEEWRHFRKLLAKEGRRTYKAKLWVKKSIAAGQNPIVMIRHDGTTGLYCEMPLIDECGPYLTQMVSREAVKKELIRLGRFERRT